VTDVLDSKTDARIAYFVSFANGAPHVPKERDAYVHVRLTEPIPPKRWMVAYLDDGSAIVVPGDDLVFLTPANLQDSDVTANEANGEVNKHDGHLAATDDHADR
jgi:hypothetical protein